LQSSQTGAQGSGEEAEIAHFHETARQDVLEEALDEMLHGEGTGFELAGIGGSILKGDLRNLQATAMIKGDQTPVAEGDAVDVGSQVFEGSLPVAHPLAMYDPFSSPDFCRDLCVERRSA